MIKKDLKLLRSVSKKPRSRAWLLDKFSPDQIERMFNSRYIQCDQEAPVNESGFPIGDIPLSAMYSITVPDGLSVKESYDWFDVQYFVTHILVPFLIGVFSGIGTYAISSLLP